MITRYVCSERTLAKTIAFYKNKNVIPILDYAIESNVDSQSINKFINKKKTLFEKYTNSYHSLKLSSINFNQNVCDSLVQHAKENNVKVLIDAENSLVQDTIDLISNTMVKRKGHDKEVFKTYQMYRKDMMNILRKDLIEYKHSDLCHNIKLVRGAYMLQDKKYDIIHTNKQETNDAYNEAINLLISTAKYNKNINVIFATHNKESFDLIKNTELSNVYHASLMGMEQPFIDSGVVQKMVHLPFGPFHKTYPYLFRRLCENNPILDELIEYSPINQYSKQYS